MTWRASEELLGLVRRAAARQGRSMNDFVTAVLEAATDPELAGDEADRVRERLAAAGLLAPASRSARRPDPRAVAAARAAAGRGTPLARIVDEDRG